MALTANVELLNTLPDVVLCGNSIPLQFQASTNLIEDEGGIKAEIVLTFSSAAEEDDYFDLLLKGETVRFTCKTVPDNSGVQFHDNDLSAALNDWVTLAAADLKKNYLIARYYNLVVSGADITITAKTEGAEFSLDFTAGPGVDYVSVDDSNTEGLDITFRAFYGIVVLLYCRDVFVTELILNVDGEGFAETNIADLLKPYLKQEFEWPESDASFIFDCPEAVAPFYFLYGEKWGNSDYKALTSSATYYVMFGGVSWMQQAKLNSDGESFWAKLQYNMYFLSWAPLTRIIGPAEPVKLYFINHTAAAALKLIAKLYTADSDSTVTLGIVEGTADKAMYEMVLSPAKLPVLEELGETLLKYEVWVENEDDVRISEIRAFVLDHSHYEHTRYFIFRNSLGAFESLRTTGLLISAGNYNREIANVEADTGYTSKDREDLSVSNIEQQKFTLAMGWLSRYGNADEYRNWLRDFARSREVYQVIGTTLKPVRITSDNLDAGKDRDSAKGFTFEFVNAFTDEHFTKEITWNLEDESFSSDFEKAQ